LSYQFGKLVGITGPCCIQFIKEDNTDKYWFIEINARFGGGTVLSINAGFNIIDLIYRDYILNEDLSTYQSNWKVGYYMCRSFKGHYFQL
jgi:carbamoyl-phosphate synthase large subunit